METADEDITPRSERSSEVWTIPNAISIVRLALIVVFAVAFAQREDLVALIALVLAGISDFLDGFLARRWNQVTELGRLLDPAADRLLTLAVVVTFLVRGILPWPVFAAILLRDIVVAVALVVGRRRGNEPPQVTYVGKAATATLYVLFPLAYVTHEWFPAWWGLVIAAFVAAIGLYWWSAVGYVRVATATSQDTAGGGADADSVEP